MRVTIKDIARLAGIDTGAVSRTLRNHPEAQRLRAETRERIIRIANELGYQRNLLASSTRTGIVNTIAVILQFKTEQRPIDLDETHAGIINRCTQLGYGVKMYSDENIEKTLEAIGGNMIRHIISMSVDDEKRRKTAEYCRKNDCKLVLIGQFQDGFPSIMADHYSGTKKAIAYLAGLGHERIGFLCAPHRYYYQRAHHRGYLDAMKEAGLEVRPDLISCSDDAESAVYKMLSLPKKQRPTAIYGIANVHAVAAQRVAIKLGIKLPEELSTFSFGCLQEVARLAFVPLSSVDEVAFGRGELSVDVLLERPVTMQPDKNNAYFAEPFLIIRDSTASCHKK